jgi:superfamily II RNA helicase
MANKKLSEEEVAKLKSYQNDTNEIVGALGQIELQFELLEEKKEEILEKFKTLRTNQSALAKELTEKYGDGNLDLEKGEIIPVE